jgi:hypothetical protein
MLVFRQAATRFGGPIMLDALAPSLSYFDMDASPAYTESSWRYVTINNLVPDYVPVAEALSTTTMYRSFYIYNEGSDAKTDVKFWISGGESFSVRNSPSFQATLHEPTIFITDEVPEHLREKFRLGGKGRTSLFGMVNAEIFLPPTKELVEFDENGFSKALNLRRVRFTSSTNKVTIPTLEANDYQGVYVKFTTRFNPDLVIPVDYSFFHLNWVDGDGARNSYPGQKRKGNQIILKGLPSVSTVFRTNYSKLSPYLEEDVENLYSQYPPFFSYYKDVEEDG